MEIIFSSINQIFEYHNTYVHCTRAHAHNSKMVLKIYIYYWSVQWQCSVFNFTFINLN